MKIDAAADTVDITGKSLEERTIPIVEERVDVYRKRVEIGRVTVALHTQLSERVVEENLLREVFEVQHVPVGRIVDEAPAVREEGDVTIIPVIEEVVVVERRLVLKEEIHLRRVSIREPFLTTVATRTQTAVVSRTQTAAAPPQGNSPDHYANSIIQKDNIMSEETIVALFDSPEQANAAVRDLIDGGVPESMISRHSRAERQGAAEDEGTEIDAPKENFWSRLFGGSHDHDHEVYDRSIEAGSTIISVKVPLDHVLLVTEVLDRHHPIDIDERASGYGFGASGPDAVTTPYPETSYDSPVASHLTAPVPAAPEPVSLQRPRETDAASNSLQLSEERLVVGKRVINQGGTRIRRYVVESPAEERIDLREERVVVERRPVTETVTADAEAFRDRTIEMIESREEPVVSKTAYVTEEVKLRKEAVDRVETVRDTVRREEVEVEELPEEPGIRPTR